MSDRYDQRPKGWRLAALLIFATVAFMATMASIGLMVWSAL